MKDAQTKGEARSPQKRKIQRLKIKTLNFFLFSLFVDNFCPPGSGIRIQPTKFNADLDGSMRIRIQKSLKKVI
jgi:hypothetical protein